MRVTFAVLIILIALTGCRDPKPAATYPNDVLRGYQAQYDAVRATLAAVVLPPAPNPARQPSCDRPVTPGFDHISYKNARNDATGNVEVMMAQDLAVQAPRRFSVDEFVVEPGILHRSLQATSAKGPLGSNEIPVDAGFGSWTDETGTLDPPTRMRKFLDAGLRMRYVVALRVLSYTPPDLEPVDPAFGQGDHVIGGVTVDASVIDLQTGDVPCRFQASGHAGYSATWIIGRETPRQAIYQDVRLSLSVDIDDVLGTLGTS